MKIKLEEPFKTRWRNGYIVTNPENRKNICLVNNDKDRTTVSYARYLMCVKLGYVLSNEFEVDHIDDDKTNDDINNLQVLTWQQNKLKEDQRFTLFEQEHYAFICEICGTHFLQDLRQGYKFKMTGIFPACSKSCGNIKASISLKNFYREKIV